MRAGSRRWVVATLVFCCVSFPHAFAAGKTTSGIAAPPREWTDYALIVSVMMRAWLAEDTEPAQRLHQYFQRAIAAGDTKEPILPVSVWIDATGQITRIEHQLFVHPQANDDLQVVLVGRNVSAKPPPDLPFPIRLQLRLRPTASKYSPGDDR